MKRVLFGMFPAWGHVAPTVAIAQELQERGHRVVYAMHPALAGRLERAGLEILPGFHWGERAVRSQEHLQRHGADLSWFLRVVRGRPGSGFVHDLARGVEQLRQAIRTFRPDVLVSDLLCAPGPIAAELEGLPYATSCANVIPQWDDDLPPYGSGIAYDAPKDLRWRARSFLSHGIRRSMDRAINRARRVVGLASQAGPFASFSAWLVLAYVTEALEYPRPSLGRQVHYIGPSLSRSRGDHRVSFPWEWLVDRPLVPVSLGTIFLHYQAFLRKCAEASRGQPWQMVIRIGPSFDRFRLRDLPDNVLLVPELPQLELLKRSSVMLSHAGLNSCLEALAEGVPLVLAPVALDQPDAAARVVRAGAGLRIDLRRDGADKIRRALQRVLDETAFRENARRIGADLRMCNAPVVGADLIERLAETRKPVLRAEGHGPTTHAKSLIVTQE